MDLNKRRRFIWNSTPTRWRILSESNVVPWMRFWMLVCNCSKPQLISIKAESFTETSNLRTSSWTTRLTEITLTSSSLTLQSLPFIQNLKSTHNSTNHKNKPFHRYLKSSTQDYMAQRYLTPLQNAKAKEAIETRQESTVLR